MRWINASERLPGEQRFHFGKDAKGRKYVVFYTYGGKMEIDAEDFEEEGQLPEWATMSEDKETITCNSGWYEICENRGYYDEMTYPRDIVEWLDESPDPLTERLKAAEALIDATPTGMNVEQVKLYNHWMRLKNDTKDLLP